MSTLRPSSLGSSVLLAAALVAVPAAARAQSAVSLTASPPGVSPGATVTLQATVAPAWNQDCGYGCAVIGIQSYLQIAGSNGYYTYTAGYDANGLGLPDSDPGPGQALQPVTYTASGGYHYDLCYYEPGFEFYGCIYGYGSYDEAGSANASVYPAVVPAAVDVSPSSGTGTHQTFVFHYSSAAGASDIGQTWQIVYPSGQGIPSCVIGWYRGTPGTFVLWGDVGWQDQQSAAPNTAVTLENSQCQLHMANTSVSGTGNTLTITTDVTFKPATAGPKVVVMYGWSAGGGYGSQTAAGSWTVPVACEVSPQQTSVPAAAGAVTISVLNGCPWSVPATSGFLTADGATSGSGGTITYSYPANSGAQRAANVTVGDQTVTVTQLAHDQTPTDDVVVYYHTDAIGSVRLVTDANGAPMRAHDFLPFGQDTPAGPNGTDTFLFAGHERDAGVASDYFGARFYSSFAERFATPDPLSITDERVGEPYRLNRYAYAHNNPLRFVDPSGLDPECQEIGALGVVCTDGIVVTATSSDAEKQLVRQRLAMQQAIKDAHSLRVELGSEGGGTLPPPIPNQRVLRIQ